MQIDDALDFIRDKRNGILIALKSDGRPQSSNIAYAVGADGVIRISVTDGRAKTANLRRDPGPRCTSTATTSGPTSSSRPTSR